MDDDSNSFTIIKQNTILQAYPTLGLTPMMV
jgi:hypothetical protein